MAYFILLLQNTLNRNDSIVSHFRSHIVSRSCNKQNEYFILQDLISAG